MTVAVEFPKFPSNFSVKTLGPRSLLMSESGNATKSNDDSVYNNLPPDSLFKKIEDLNWKSAAYHLRLNPREANGWVVKTDAVTDNIAWRRLPIHEACVRQPTAEVIHFLLVSYPDSAKAQDFHGLLPLHHACIHGAGKNVLYLILDANPEAKHVKDIWGRTPFDCAMIGDEANKNTVLGILTEPSGDVAKQAASIRDECLVDQPSHTLAASILINNQQSSEPSQKEKDLAKKVNDLEAKLEVILQTYEEREAAIITDLEDVSKRNTNMKFSFDLLEKKLAATEATLCAKNDLIEQLYILVDVTRFDQEMKKVKDAHEEELNKLNQLMKESELKHSEEVVCLKECLEKAELKHNEVVSELKQQLDDAMSRMALMREEFSASNLKLEDNVKKLSTEKAEILNVVAKMHQDAKVSLQVSKQYKEELVAFEEYKTGAEARMDALETVVSAYATKIVELEKAVEHEKQNVRTLEEKEAERKRFEAEKLAEARRVEAEKLAEAQYSAILQQFLPTDMVESVLNESRGSDKNKELEVNFDPESVAKSALTQKQLLEKALSFVLAKGSL